MSAFPFRASALSKQSIAKATTTISTFRSTTAPVSTANTEDRPLIEGTADVFHLIWTIIVAAAIVCGFLLALCAEPVPTADSNIPTGMGVTRG